MLSNKHPPENGANLWMESMTWLEVVVLIEVNCIFVFLFFLPTNKA